MQAIMETVFDIVYLSTVTFLGFTMMIKGKSKIIKMFGWMAIILGFGDSFHLVPRAYALLTTGLEANAAALGIGKLITSITMTIFYIILYHIWEIRYQKNNRNLTIVMYLLAIVRIALCLLPQNQWLAYRGPLDYAIYRNIPFAIMGIIIIVLFYREAKKHNDLIFKWMYLAIILSFAFYIPVVLFADTYQLIGILMIPKTIAYVWVVWMGYKAYLQEKDN